jgi:hypothetical protein
VTKAARYGKFLVDYDKDCKAAVDYTTAFDALDELLRGDRSDQAAR